MYSISPEHVYRAVDADDIGAHRRRRLEEVSRPAGDIEEAGPRLELLGPEDPGHQLLPIPDKGAVRRSVMACIVAVRVGAEQLADRPLPL